MSSIPEFTEYHTNSDHMYSASPRFFNIFHLSIPFASSLATYGRVASNSGCVALYRAFRWNGIRSIRAVGALIGFAFVRLRLLIFALTCFRLLP